MTHRLDIVDSRKIYYSLIHFTLIKKKYFKDYVINIVIGSHGKIVRETSKTIDNSQIIYI